MKNNEIKYVQFSFEDALMFIGKVVTYNNKIFVITEASEFSISAPILTGEASYKFAFEHFKFLDGLPFGKAINGNLKIGTMTTSQFEQKQASMSNEELIELASKQISELARTGGRSHKMSVPPEITDTDMVLCELIKRFKATLT